MDDAAITALVAETARQNEALKAEIDDRREGQRTNAKRLLVELAGRRAELLRLRQRLEEDNARHPERLVGARVIRRRIAFGVAIGTFVASAVTLSASPHAWLLAMISAPAFAWANWLRVARAERSAARDAE